MEIKGGYDMNINSFYSLLLELYAKQENLKIKYVVERKKI